MSIAEMNPPAKVVKPYARTLSAPRSSYKSSSVDIRALAVVLWIAAVLLIQFAPGAGPAALVPIALMASLGRQRLISSAVLVSALVTVYGASGIVQYFGLTTINDQTLATAMMFHLFFSLGAFLGAGSARSLPTRYSPTLKRVWIVIASVAITVLVARFALTGVPLFGGNSGRLAGVAGLPPLFGLASGGFPILTAYIPSGKGKPQTILKAAVALLVFGTGSRLLLAAVILGFVYQAVNARQEAPLGRRARRGTVLAVIGILALVFAVVSVYDLRTDEGAAVLWEGRVTGVDGLSGVVTGVLGPSLYLAARNGLVVFEMMQSGAYHPPHGFIWGGIGNTFGVVPDPERWLTVALGLDVTSAGAVATPIWSGAWNDFGPASTLLAFFLGWSLARWTHRFPSLAPWAAFAIVLSSYGSYLVSAQFVITSLLLTAILWKTGVPSDRRQVEA